MRVSCPLKSLNCKVVDWRMILFYEPQEGGKRPVPNCLFCHTLRSKFLYFMVTSYHYLVILNTVEAAH